MLLLSSESSKVDMFEYEFILELMSLSQLRAIEVYSKRGMYIFKVID